MIALFIMTLAAGGIYYSIGQTLNMTSNSRDLTRVSQILQSEMENLRAMNWTDYATMVGTQAFTPHSRFTNEFEDRYSLERSITKIADDHYEASVTASWTDRLGHTHTREYTSYFTKDGLNDYYYRVLQ